MTTLDTDKVYEWFVVENNIVVRNRKALHILGSSCVTEDYTIREEFTIDPNTHTCPSLDHRMKQLFPNYLQGEHKPYEFLIKGFHYFAKVQALWPTKANVQNIYYVFNPFTFTNHSKVEQPTRSLKDGVLMVVAKKLSRSSTLSELEQLGAEYVREYRNMQKSGEV